ncbi:DNA replication/repair protein RecF [Leptothermofonsia sichuanensis E412]|uniref:DNA replication/repair protein RecF n=1 Tax=Leptothermofonsia sichuanensis TaxID=2917832 RepID=UPI001CA69BD4|nr:DNA replication/repair protein RecF [Leptothermofonsia sichuanensis]QZZ19039.1 DNA replication/repair protein RecF [Leptothermofonsia sichuanensis E412]
MYLRSLHLRQFRNYLDQQVKFDAPKTILVGDNAQGKSNLLEAVELLSTLRSHRTSRDRDLVLNGAAIAQITGQVERNFGSVELAMTLRSNSRRTVAINGESLRRQLDFLGILNVVEFSSLDLDLIRGGPEQRRNWLDSLLIQLEPVYAYILQQYNQVLRQRNALLKRNQEPDARNQEEAGAIAQLVAASPDALSSPSSQTPSPSTELALWDAQLIAAGTRVIRRRARVVQRLVPLAAHWHREISGSTEDLDVRYAPNVPLKEDDPEIIKQGFLEKIQARAIAERYQGTTLVGPHRDEVEFTINQTSARQYGSQGQQRTLVLALKLAELKLIEDVIGDAPLLLLDDVLAELDLNRQNQLLNAIQDRYQTLITTTHLGAFDAQWLRSSQVFSVKAGQVFVGR